jgi:hypothetical protein
MLRFWPYAPALVVILGAFIAAVGSCWQAVRQSNFNAEIRSKNEQIITLQQENIHTVKGANLIYAMIMYEPNRDGQFPLYLVTDIWNSQLPVYDVDLLIRSHVDRRWDTFEHMIEAWDPKNADHHRIGNVPPGATNTQVYLEPGYYQINIQTRYQLYIERLKFGPFGTAMGQSYIVTDFSGMKVFTKETSPDGFPKIYGD